MTFPKSLGGPSLLSPKPDSPGWVPSPPSSDITKSNVYKWCQPSSEARGTRAVVLNTPPLLSPGAEEGLLFSQIFRGSRVGDGEGWEHLRPSVQAGLARIQVNLTHLLQPLLLFSLSLLFPVPSQPREREDSWKLPFQPGSRLFPPSCTLITSFISYISVQFNLSPSGVGFCHLRVGENPSSSSSALRPSGLASAVCQSH